MKKQYKPAKEFSKKHPNRRANNWLIYEVNDKFLEKYKDYYRGKLVDLGCGEAIYKDFFLQFCDKYIGVDWGNSYHNTKADIISDLNKRIKLPKNYADTVVSMSVMEHLYNPEQFLKEAYRILKPEGHFILQVPWQWWIHEQPYDYYRYTPFSLKLLFENAGFRILEISPVSGFFTTWFLKFNYFSEIFLLRKKNKISKTILSSALRPIWYINQKLAPFLDRYDKDWYLETVGYWVLAKKEINNGK